MRRLVLVVIFAVAGGFLPLVLHATARLGTSDHPASTVWSGVANSILAAAEQLPAAPGVGHGFLIDKHIAAGLACDSCHATTPFQAASTTTCLSCHGVTFDKLAAMTASDSPNPHQSHQGDVPCASCHHVHVASENFCSQCHSEFDLKVP
ncbi:MAG: cytochrome c3 family protein [Roseiarcus sp.]